MRPSRSEFRPSRPASACPALGQGRCPHFVSAAWLDGCFGLLSSLSLMSCKTTGTSSPPTGVLWPVRLASLGRIFAEHLGDMEALLDHYAPSGNVRLAGHSMGGIRLVSTLASARSGLKK